MKGIWSKLIKNNNSTAGFRSDVNKGDELPEVLGKDGSTKDAKRKEVQYQYTPEGKLITTNLSNLELFQDFKKWVTPKDTKDFRGEDFEAVFNGSEAIDEMMKKWDLKDRNDGLEIGKAFVEEELIEIANPSARNVFREGQHYFYRFVEKKDISLMSTKELYIEFLTWVRAAKKDGNFNVISGADALNQMTENWLATRETCLETATRFLEEEFITFSPSNSSGNASIESNSVFKDSPDAYYNLVPVQESLVDKMKQTLEKISTENYKTVENQEFSHERDYESFPFKTQKPAWINQMSDLQKAIQLESQKSGTKNQFDRDAKLWRLTLRYPGNLVKRDIMRRILTLLRFAPFFCLTQGGACLHWFETGLPIATALSHGSRITIQTPPSSDPMSPLPCDYFWNWLITGDRNGDLSKFMTLESTGEDCEKAKRAIFKRTAATHGISLNVRECLKDGYVKYIKEERTVGVSVSSLVASGNDYVQTVAYPHWGMNIAFGGHGLTSIFGEKISANGENGHFYICHYPPTEQKCGGILIGLEGSEVGKYDQYGHKHNIQATSATVAVGIGFKWADVYKKVNSKNNLPTELFGKDYPRKMDGMFIDLSHGYEIFERLALKWNDDWVMEPAIKPPKVNARECVFSNESMTVEDKFDLIRLMDLKPKERMKMYQQFVTETSKSMEDWKHKIQAEMRTIGLAREMIDHINANMDMLLKDDLLQLLTQYRHEWKSVREENDQIRKKNERLSKALLMAGRRLTTGGQQQKNSTSSPNNANGDNSIQTSPSSDNPNQLLQSKSKENVDSIVLDPVDDASATAVNGGSIVNGGGESPPKILNDGATNGNGTSLR